MAINPCKEIVTMPLSGHKPSELVNALRFINECGLPIEVFDAFLAEYAKTNNLEKSIWFATCEWDL